MKVPPTSANSDDSPFLAAQSRLAEKRKILKCEYPWSSPDESTNHANGK